MHPSAVRPPAPFPLTRPSCAAILASCLLTSCGTSSGGAGGGATTTSTSGPTTSTSTVTTTSSSSSGCDAAASPIPNTALVEAAGLGGCPAGMLLAGSACVDRYEAALVRVADGSPVSPFVSPGELAVRAVSVAGAVPQGYIDAERAAAACAAAGKRLCTSAEWLRACQGPAATVYPYGASRQPGLCNDARAVLPPVEYFGTSDAWIYQHLDNACLNQLPDTVDRSGASPGCSTAEGALDMMGNLAEWTSDAAGTLRGGSYIDTRMNGEGCLYTTTAHARSYADYTTGFRCCADAP